MDTTFNYSGFVDMFLSPEERAEATLPGVERALGTPAGAATDEPPAARSVGLDESPRTGGS